MVTKKQSGEKAHDIENSVDYGAATATNQFDDFVAICKTTQTFMGTIRSRMDRKWLAGVAITFSLKLSVNNNVHDAPC